MHGVQRRGGVRQAFALLDGRGRERHPDHGGADAAGGEVEGNPGPGRVLEEEVEDRDALEMAERLAAGQVGELVRPVEKAFQLRGLHALDAEEVVAVDGCKSRRVVRVAGGGAALSGGIGTLGHELAS